MRWHDRDGVSVLVLEGRFDAAVATRVAEWLDATDERPSADAIVDLGAVTFIDSTALATLVKGLRRCRQLNGDLVLCGLQKAVSIIFEVTRLNQAFAIYQTEDAAFASLRFESQRSR